MMTKKIFPIGTVLLFLSFMVLFILAFLSLSPPQKTVPRDLVGVLRSHAIPLQPFTLTDQNGQLYTEKRLKRKWSFFFFGYTYCPDVCPTTLSMLKIVTSELKKDPKTAPDMQVIFVSVDPDRDKPEVLARYMEYFGREFTGVTGFPNELFNFSRQFGAAYIKEAKSASGDYLISHTSWIFLVDPQARIVASFSPPHNPQTITSQYKKIHELFR